MADDPRTPPAPQILLALVVVLVLLVRRLRRRRPWGGGQLDPQARPRPRGRHRAGPRAGPRRRPTRPSTRASSTRRRDIIAPARRRQRRRRGRGDHPGRPQHRRRRSPARPTRPTLDAIRKPSQLRFRAVLVDGRGLAAGRPAHPDQDGDRHGDRHRDRHRHRHGDAGRDHPGPGLHDRPERDGVRGHDRRQRAAIPAGLRRRAPDDRTTTATTPAATGGRRDEHRRPDARPADRHPVGEADQRQRPRLDHARPCEEAVRRRWTAPSRRPSTRSSTTRPSRSSPARRTARPSTSSARSRSTAREIADALAGYQAGPNGQPTSVVEVALTFNGDGAKKFGDVTKRLLGLQPAPQNQFAIVLDKQVISRPAHAGGDHRRPGQHHRHLHHRLGPRPRPAAEVRRPADVLRAADPGRHQPDARQRAAAHRPASPASSACCSSSSTRCSSTARSAWSRWPRSSSPRSSRTSRSTLLGWSHNFRLTMAGVTGLIVAIGVTADSFIVYFERIRDEVRDGRPLVAAVETGWARARRTILAADAVNFLAAGVLYFLASSNVRGFAFTLGLTTLIDLLVVMLFTHPIVAAAGPHHVLRRRAPLVRARPGAARRQGPVRRPRPARPVRAARQRRAGTAPAPVPKPVGGRRTGVQPRGRPEAMINFAAGRQRPLHRQAVDRLHRPAEDLVRRLRRAHRARPRRHLRPRAQLRHRVPRWLGVPGPGDVADGELRAEGADRDRQRRHRRQRRRDRHRRQHGPRRRPRRPATKHDAAKTALAKAVRGDRPTSSAPRSSARRWGASVSQQAIQGLVVFLILVTIVMALYFRTWKMAVAGLVALLHDLVITVGIYALFGFEITPSSMIGFLTILGYSLYDTVVVFDKVRENTAAAFVRRAGMTYRAGRQPRRQPDPGPLDQHDRRGAAADRGDPRRRLHAARPRHAARPVASRCSSASRSAPTPRSSSPPRCSSTCAATSRRSRSSTRRRSRRRPRPACPPRRRPAGRLSTPVRPPPGAVAAWRSPTTGARRPVPAPGVTYATPYPVTDPGA